MLSSAQNHLNLYLGMSRAVFSPSLSGGMLGLSTKGSVACVAIVLATSMIVCSSSAFNGPGSSIAIPPMVAPKRTASGICLSNLQWHVHVRYSPLAVRISVLGTTRISFSLLCIRSEVS